MPWRGIFGVFMYFIISLVFYASIYYSNLQERILQEQKLKMNVKEAELNFLRSQINPHFLFNSLNSISSLTLVDAEKARNMIIRLSNFLRYSLGKDQVQVVSLKEEIDNCKAYLEIEKIRFSDRLEFTINVEEGLEQKKIPNLLLQPLLENAIKHGVYESTETVEIKVDIIDREESLKIVIGNKFDPTAIPRKGKGIGIKNVKERLRLIYDNDKLIKFMKEENYYEVTLFIPQNN
jgi:two-component system, LytTR family, sensor kinase